MKNRKNNYSAKAAGIPAALDYLKKPGLTRGNQFLTAEFSGKKRRWLTIEKAAEFSKKLILDFDFLAKNGLFAEKIKAVNSEKLRLIAGFGFNTFLTCQNERCFKNKTCYALKSHYLDYHKIFNDTINFFLLNARPDDFRAQIRAFFALNPFNFCRWFENGDLFSVENLETFSKIALENENITFLLMTKKTEFVNAFIDAGGVIPNNLIIRLSDDAIDGIKSLNPHNLPTTDIIKPGSPIPAGCIRCPGVKTGCAACRACFNAKIKRILFDLH